MPAKRASWRLVRSKKLGRDSTATRTAGRLEPDTTARTNRRELTPVKDKKDDLYHHVERVWDTIWTAYKEYAKKGPIILYDVQDERVYAYPYKAFKDGLSERSQKSLRDQYQEAGQRNEIVVFVRDNIKKKLVSYSLPAE